MKRTMSIVAATSLLMLMVSGGCGQKNDESDAEVKPRATVEVAPALVGSINEVVTATGSFQVLRDERIKSTINGKVESVLVLEGDAVTRGQVLVTILSQESNAAIAGAEQLLSQASSDPEKANAQRALDLANHSATFAKIRAPFSGDIVHRFVTEGELVTQGTDLVEVVDPASKYFLANIPLADVSAVKKGMSVAVAIPSMRVPPFSGTVQALNPATDPNSQSVQVRVAFKSLPPLVTAGTFANAEIQIGRHGSSILIPKPAVFHDDELDQDFVWRIQGDTLALLTRVTTGLSDSSRIEITFGLKPGEVVATVGGYGLPDSTSVTVAGH